MISSSTANITNSTISGNTAATGEGGGVFVLGSTANITNSTISGNTAGDDGGGVFAVVSSTATIKSSIIAGNTATNSGNDISSDSTINSSCYNLIGNDDQRTLANNLQ